MVHINGIVSFDGVVDGFRMAPEVLDNKKYTEKADIYSYGILIWELYERKVPYDGKTGVQVCTMKSQWECRRQWVYSSAAYDPTSPLIVLKV